MAKESLGGSTVIRLAISVEGPTEQEFVKNVLVGHLRVRGIESQPVVVGHSGGNITVQRVASDMANLIWKFDHVTSLVDFYGFQDKGEASIDELERQIGEAVDSKIARPWDQSRLIPYVQRHEFEALLFSDVTAFSKVLLVPESTIEALEDIRSRFTTPEDIDDGITTAPSKRILATIPSYHKRVAGPLVAQETGLDTIRAECPRFHHWLGRLESLGESIS